MRERGLKFGILKGLLEQITVAPHAGAWIEMTSATITRSTGFVAPHAGAWIEIVPVSAYPHLLGASLPMRERGLKSF